MCDCTDNSDADIRDPSNKSDEICCTDQQILLPIIVNDPSSRDVVTRQNYGSDAICNGQRADASDLCKHRISCEITTGSPQTLRSDAIFIEQQIDLSDACKETCSRGIVTDWKTTITLQSPDEADGCACTVDNRRARSSDCSSDSTRHYNFVSPRMYESGEDEEAVPEYSPIIRVTEENEETEAPDIECTLAMIKPEAMAHRREIENRMIDEGFEIYQTRWLQLTPEQTSEFYNNCYGHTNFAGMVAHVSSSPIMVMVLAKHRAVQEWIVLMGPAKVAEARLYFPDSIRAKFGHHQCDEEFKNAVHGSSSRKRAEKEIHFFFPEFIIEPLMKGEIVADYLWKVINQVLLEGLTLCCKRKPADPILWLSEWLILNNPNRPKISRDLAVIPT